jgi:UDP-sugar transporter A1/2/3
MSTKTPKSGSPAARTTVHTIATAKPTTTTSGSGIGSDGIGIGMDGQLTKISRWLASPKGLVLLLLVIQNSGHTLLTGYTQKTLKQKYIPSTVILLSEFVKTAFSYYMIDANTLDHSKLIQTSLPMAVPAFLYFINNWLMFFALKTLSPAVYATLAQLKLLTTAIFAVFMLGKHLSVAQWRALMLLTVGSVLVQTNPCADANADTSASSLMSGSLAMLVYALLSGFSGIYFEKVLKGTKLSLWERNVQLGTYSMIVALFSLVSSSDQIAANGFFGGYSFLTLLIVFTSAAGGLLVALVVKYGDNIVKGFATAFAIVLTAILGWLFMGGDMSVIFMAGASNVIMSIFIYSDGEPVRRIVSGSMVGMELEREKSADLPKAKVDSDDLEVETSRSNSPRNEHLTKR